MPPLPRSPLPLGVMEEAPSGAAVQLLSEAVQRRLVRVQLDTIRHVLTYGL